MTWAHMAFSLLTISACGQEKGKLVRNMLQIHHCDHTERAKTHLDGNFDRWADSTLGLDSDTAAQATVWKAA